MASFVGIDLGTTFSAIATIDDTGRPVIVHNKEGQNITPSCVHEEQGNLNVGDEARKTWAISPDAAAARFKRDMGTSKTHTINGREFTPTELSTLVLKKLKEDASATLGPITEAVVTIPANFSNEARAATMLAAKEAGLNIRYIINEPTAAALYYAFKSGDALHGNYAVYDLGGGTFDVSIIHVDGQDVKVLASNGVQKLGGDDFDEALRVLVKKKYEEVSGEVLELEDFTKNEAEDRKKSLSQRTSLKDRINRQIISISRVELEETISALVAQAELLCEATIEEAKIQVSDISAVLLAGGSTRIPLVQESIKRVFGQDPVVSANVDEVVALGAALYAAYKGDQSQLSPTQQNAIKKIKIAESTAKCFGTLILEVETERGPRELSNHILIHKGDKIPCSVKETFYTVADGQTAVTCELTESASPETDPKFVKRIWEGELKLPPGRPKHQEIEVTYSYDDNQMMKCSYVDVATGKRVDVDISQAGSKDSDDDNGVEKFMVD